MDVSYKKKKRYKTAKYPLRQSKFFTWLTYFLSKIMLIGKKYEIERVGMENLKPPYMILSNHMHFIDFEIGAVATYPNKVNNVVSIDGYYHMPFLLEWIGGIATRRFTKDLHLIKSIKKVFDRGDILCMYPEARYTNCGIPLEIPNSLGKIIKMNKVPVVIAKHHGNYLRAPIWDYKSKRNVPLKTVYTLTLTPEQIEKMSVSEINKAINEAFYYNEYTYQKENNILITEKYRAQNLHKILYQCPNCNTEFKMNSRGAEIFCTKCGKRWTLLENGDLQANEGETEFSHIPDWYNWERQNVRKQILDGTYYIQDEVTVYSLPNAWGFVPLGNAKFRHDIVNGLTLEGTYLNSKYQINRQPLETLSLHVEYNYYYYKHKDCFDISTENDSYYCFPTKKNYITKLAFAVEELYKIKQEEVKKDKNKAQ